MPLLGWSEKGNCLSSKETAECLKKKRKREGNILYNTKKRTLELLKQKMIWITTSLQSTWVCNLASEIPWRLFYNLAAQLVEKKKIVDKTKASLSVPCCGCEMNLCNKVLFKAWAMVLCSWLYLILKESSLNSVAQPDAPVAFAT